MPYAREKVITCYGIIGVLSLATSTSIRLLHDLLIAITVGEALTDSRLHPDHHRPNPLLPTPVSPHLPRDRLPPSPSISTLDLRDDSRSSSGERADFARRGRPEEHKVVVLPRLGLNQYASKAKGPGGRWKGCRTCTTMAESG